MAAEQTYVAEYMVETPEVVPLIPALEELARGPRTTTWWRLFPPGGGEPVHTTTKRALAEAWSDLGGVTEVNERPVPTRRKTRPVKVDAWRGRVKAWAVGEGLDWGADDGSVTTWGDRVRVRTPSRLGTTEHLRRRRMVEAVLRQHELQYAVECATEHSDQVCRPLFAEDQGTLDLAPAGPNGGGN